MPTKDDVISNIQTITKQINEILLIIKKTEERVLMKIRLIY